MEMAAGLGFGALIGLALGSLGAGGSILTVPILVYAMGAPVQTATGTSLAIVGLNALAGAIMHLRAAAHYRGPAWHSAPAAWPVRLPAPG